MDKYITLPLITDRPDEHTPAVARHRAVWACQSGVADDSLRLSRTYGNQLAEALATVWTTVSELHSLEVFALTGSSMPILSIHGSSTAEHNTGWMAEHNTETSGPVGTKEISAALESHLPDWYGIEQGTLVLDPIGLSATPTSRLVYTDTNPSRSAYESILRSILLDNHSRNVPTVCQLLLHSPHVRNRSDSGRYRVTLRVAELGAEPRPLGRRGLADSIETPRACPIDWETPETITSSLRLADRHWEVQTDQYNAHSYRGLYTVDPTSTSATWYHGPVSASPAALAAARLRDCTHEYAAMLQGVEGRTPYGPLDGTATLSLSSADLASLLDVTPLYEPCSWPAGGSRSPPRFIRDRICSQAAGTTHNKLLADPQPSMTQRGLQAGPSLWEFTRGWLDESGCLSSSHDRRTLGLAHFVGHPIDPDGPVVLFDPCADRRGDHDGEDDVSLIDSAGELIVAANKAVHNDSHLLVVTPTEAIAKQARDILAVSYAAQVGPSDYKLHTVPKAVTTDDGEVIVVERETPPLSWVVSNGTQRSLHTPERCLSSGPLTEPVAAQRYATPRMCGINPPIEMENSDGTVRETLSSRAACMDDYRPVLYPVVPIVPLFCDRVSVVYRDGTDLTEPLSSRDWTASTEESTPEDHIECALEQFAEQYTSERLFGRTPGFFGQFRGWYGNYSTHKLCHVERLGQLLPDGVGVHTNMIGDPIGITGRQWWIDTEDLSLAVLHDF